MMDIFNRKGRKGAFYLTAVQQMLLSLHENKEAMSLTQMHLETGMTYAYVNNTVKEMEKAGLISKNKQGRKTMVSLTDDGSRRAAHVKGFVEND